MKFKGANIFLFTFLFVYLLSFCGLTINKHFCGGELETVSLMEPEACCEDETPEEPGDCCENESLYLSNQTESISSQKITVDFKPVYFQTIISPVLFELSFIQTEDPSLRIPDKPPFIEEELVARTMVLRI